MAFNFPSYALLRWYKFAKIKYLDYRLNKYLIHVIFFCLGFVFVEVMKKRSHVEIKKRFSPTQDIHENEWWFLAFEYCCC